MDTEARFYEREDSGRVKCGLCPHRCSLGDGKTGLCGVRTNRGGTLYTSIYGELSAIAMDPIEKKPLFHFYPGKSILSVGTVGCSFRCGFCQNHHISQDPGYPTEYKSPEETVSLARDKDSIGIAYTYSEPMVWYEWVIDTCRLAREQGLKNVFVTNGFINRKPLRELLVYADAFNVDLKSFSEEFYKKHVGGRLGPVLETIAEISKKEEITLEVTTLIIPGHNDSEGEMERLVSWLSSLRPDIPYHLSAYYPMYHFSAPPTPVSTLRRLKEVAQKKLRYVYLGNVSGESNTRCANCNAVLVRRSGYRVEIEHYENGRCTSCGELVPIKG